MAPGSPASTSRETAGPLIAPFSARSAASVVADAAGVRDLVRLRSSARPEAYCSMHPLCPQPHGSRRGRSACGRAPPPMPRPPRKSWPSSTIAPPTPVPIVSIIMSSTSRPAPNRNSAQPAAFASFSIVTGTSMRASRVALSGSLRQSMFGAWMTVARSRSMKPGRGDADGGDVVRRRRSGAPCRRRRRRAPGCRSGCRREAPRRSARRRRRRRPRSSFRRCRSRP